MTFASRPGVDQTFGFCFNSCFYRVPAKHLKTTAVAVYRRAEFVITSLQLVFTLRIFPLQLTTTSAAGFLLPSHRSRDGLRQSHQRHILLFCQINRLHAVQSTRLFLFLRSPTSFTVFFPDSSTTLSFVLGSAPSNPPVTSCLQTFFLLFFPLTFHFRTLQTQAFSRFFSHVFFLFLLRTLFLTYYFEFQLGSIENDTTYHYYLFITNIK